MTPNQTHLRRAALPLAFAALMAFGPACGWRDTPIFSIGQYDLPQQEVLNRIEGTLRERGYAAQHVDVAHGTITVPASYVHKGNASTFTIQCYRDGWVAVRMTGAYVRIDGDDATVPTALRDEYRTFVMALSESLGAQKVEG